MTEKGFAAEALHCRNLLAQSPLGYSRELPGPVGERNLYALLPRGTLLCVARSEAGLLRQVGTAFATGNCVLLPAGSAHAQVFDTLPNDLRGLVSRQE
ncbi:MAG: hypothetical protein VW600_18710, partial [Ferrovibrio sp.]